ncbi:MAG: UbiD family decarboxylase [Bacillota bacterium]|nr:UbiD family decarboxylase [Bacillota bacterium]
MTFSMRDYLAFLESRGELVRVKKQVDPQFELGYLLKETKGTKPFYFENVSGYQMPVVGGLAGDRNKLAECLGVTPNGLIPKMIKAISNPIPARSVAAGPVHENVITSGIDIPKLMPIPTFHQKDSAPFITAGILIVKDKNYNRYFTSIRRLQVNGGNNVSILIESPGLNEMYHQLEAQNEPLEVAIILGIHPIITLSSQLSTQQFGLDKMAYAGGLAGQAFDMVKCKTVDLEVPADAEIVLEGKMIPHKRKTEGPFGELAGYYGPATEQPYVEVSAVTHRNNPIFQVVFPSSFEHIVPNGLNREASLFLHVRHLVPSVKAVHLTTAGGCRFHAVIAIDKKEEGDGKSAILAALSSNKDVKHVIVVNDDVNIFDSHDVEWAVATRVQADEDVVIIPGAKGSGLEPTHALKGVTAKMGIDATYPLKHKTHFERTFIPGSDTWKLSDYY